MLTHRTDKYSIEQVLKNRETVYVFDVDGTLTDFNYSIRAFWSPTEKPVSYDNVRPLKTMQKLISKLDRDKVFVCSRVTIEGESEAKERFLIKNFNIKLDNIYFVRENEWKVEILKEIQKRTKVEDELLLMIDDSTEVLYNVLTNTNYSNLHVSYFIE